METILEQTHLQDPAPLRRPLAELLDVVDTETNNHRRGVALEGVCIQVLRLLGYRFIGWRVRGDQTAGAEVDIVGETIYSPYQLVQMQSKASDITGREMVDREVGVAVRLKSNIILFVTAKAVVPAARRSAAAHMQESNIAILFIEGDDIRGGVAGITAAVEREWNRVRAVRSKRGQERTRALGE